MHLVISELLLIVNRWRLLKLLLLILLLLLHGRWLLLEGRLLAEGRLGDLGWLSMELLVLCPHLFHLHLLLLNDWLLMMVIVHHRLLIYLHLLWCLLHFFNHGCIDHATGGRLSVLILRPLLDLVICALDELVTQVEQDSLSAFLNDLPPNPLQRVSIDVYGLNLLVEAEPVRQSDAVVVDHR